jgi:PIN domain nuclease of toxin-antitoxin system
VTVLLLDTHVFLWWRTQAQLEGCTLVTHDELLAPYGVSTLWT